MYVCLDSCYECQTSVRTEKGLEPMLTAAKATSLGKRLILRVAALIDCLVWLGAFAAVGVGSSPVSGQ